MLYPLVLAVMTLLLILGGAMLSHQAGYRRTATRDLEWTRARLLAQAGLEDVRLKWERDPNFPPSAENTVRFAYREAMSEGAFEVEIDLRHRLKPAQVLVVSSRGISPGGARVTLVGEFDVSTPPRKPGSRWLGIADERARLP